MFQDAHNDNLGILYLVGQTVGGGLAGGVLRGVFGHDRSIESIHKFGPISQLSNGIRLHGGGCFRNSGTVSQGQALLVEIMSSFALM